MSRASDYRSRKKDRLSKLTVEATGQTFIVRRIQIDAWIMAGRMPETLAREVLTAWKQSPNPEAALNSMSVEEMLKGFHAMAGLVPYVCVSPKLVTGDIKADPDKDEIHFLELEPEELKALITYCMDGKGAVPIEETNGSQGAVTAEAVTSFPESRERHSFVFARQDG